MPEYIPNTGTQLFKDDICKSCSIIDICNVYSDLVLDRENSRWDGKHIVKKDQANGRENYIECQSYAEYIHPSKRVGRDTDFGLKISQQEADLVEQSYNDK